MGKHGPATLGKPAYRANCRPRGLGGIPEILIRMSDEEGFDLASDLYIESLCELDRRLKGEET